LLINSFADSCSIAYSVIIRNYNDTDKIITFESNKLAFMPNLSVVIITLNEEKYIEQCIRSVAEVADEIVVVDSYSTDKTEEVSRKLGARFIQHSFNGYRDQKNFALRQATYDYILSLDADEALSVELKESIIRVKQNWQNDAYKFNRLNYCCGQWIYHTDWYPDRKIRLFDRRKGEWAGGNVHETVKMIDNSKSGYLKGDLLHWSYNSFEQLIEAINKYSTLSANEYFREGVKPTMVKLVFSPIWLFFHSYFIKRGFLDGYNGFFISVSSAKLSQIKYIKLRQLYLISTSKNAKLTHQHPSLATTGIRIGFDAKRAFYNRSGLGNYSRNLIDTMVNIETDNSFFLFTPETKNRIILASKVEKAINIISPRRFYHRAIVSLWRSKFILGDIKNLKIDIYHGLSHELPFGIQETGVKTVVTVHDLIFLRFPDFYNPINVFIYRKKLEYACKVADKIVAISSQTREDLIHFLNVNPKKIEVIPQSCNPGFQKTITNEEFQNIKVKHGLPDNYLLNVGTIEERKNLLNILKALNENGIEIPLVVIGRKTGYFHKTIKPFLLENKMNSIIFPEEVNDDELPALYQNALCFIYPSFFEGFGIPVLEAITSGTPVITSKGSCFEETGGPGSIYVDPHKPGEISDAILQISGNQKFRSALVKTGFEHAKLFSPEHIAKRYLDLYKTLI
jgi:glycosyltransferase involved in cell wall biosynthesis